MTRALAAAVLAVALGCAPAAPDRHGWIVVAVQNSPTNLDPGIAFDEASQRVDHLVFSSLLTFDDHLRPAPDLATRFEMVDPQTYVAAIPPGVRFHNGREMTSADVAYTFRRFLDPAFVSTIKGAFRNLAAVDVLDRYTVAFKLRQPSGAFAINLVHVGIVPDGTITAARNPVGSGPYRLVEFVPDDHVTLAAFADYYRGRPRNEGVTIRVVPDDTMRGLELRKGDVDLVVNDLPPDLIHGLVTDVGLATVTSPGTDYAYLGMNLRDPALKDARVRQAIGYAIDCEAIVRYLRRDLAQQTAGILPPASWAYASDVFRFTHDPAKAKALLDDAGFPDPDGDGPLPRLHLTLKTSTAEAYRLQAMVLQQQLREVGLAVDIRSYEFSTLMDDIRRGNAQLFTLVFVGGADPDTLRRVYHSTQMPPDGFNRARYSNPEVDRLLDAATAALSEDDRRQYYEDAERIIARDAPLISLWTRTNVAVAQRNVTGISLSPVIDFAFLRDVSRH